VAQLRTAAETQDCGGRLKAPGAGALGILTAPEGGPGDRLRPRISLLIAHVYDSRPSGHRSGSLCWRRSNPVEKSQPLMAAIASIA
jgi:hypothetical protein